MKRIIALTTFSALLVGCAGEEGDVSYEGWNRDDIYYSFPQDEQTEVSRYTPIVVRYSDPVDFSEATISLNGPGGVVDYSQEIVDEDGDGTPDNQSLVITPDAPLQWASDYELIITGIGSNNEAMDFPGGSLNFTTRAAPRAASREESTQAETLTLTRMVPDGDDLPIMDFSSLRLQFSQPLDQASLKYGTTVSLQDSEGELVPAAIYAKGSYLTIDPVTDLTPNQSYQLNITSGLMSLFGEAASAFDQTITPKDSRPRSFMVQKVLDSNDGELLSPLTGAAINTVPLTSVLVGDQDSSQQTGLIFAELAFAPNYPTASPLRIRRGSLLQGSNLDIKVAGTIPATLDRDGDGTRETAMSTGDLAVTYISDAAGYLVPNRYSDAVDAPYHALLYMDISMTATEPEANGALSQDLLHVELNGTAIVIDGLLTIDAIGIVEPEVLGLETGYGVLSFHIEGLQDQMHQPDQPVDTTAPVLQSWMPGDTADTIDTEAPIILTFDEPLDPVSLEQEGALGLTLNGSPEPFSWYLDGSSIVLTPESGLQFPSYQIDGGSKISTQSAEYEVVLGSTISDLHGNPYTPPPAGTLTFSLDERNIDSDDDTSDGEVYAPVILTAYPGFPCAVQSENNIDLTAGTHDECAYRTDWNDSSNTENNDGDVIYEYEGDTLPLVDMPANRPIRLRFSQNMDGESAILSTGSCAAPTAGTFRVEKVDADKNCLEVIDGRLVMGLRSLTFYPDTPWEEGNYYRYILNSVLDSANCGVNALCSEDGYAVQTALLLGPTYNQGGPDLRTYFKGSSASQTVYQDLINQPSPDVNADFWLDKFETGFADANTVSKNSALIHSGGNHEPSSGITKVEEVSIGCGIDEDCPDKQGVFLTGALIAEIHGPTTWDDDNDTNTPEVDAVAVKLHPTTIVTSNLDLSVKILALGFIPIIKDSSTGPQIMSLRYQDTDGDNFREDLIDGYIVSGDDGPEFVTSVDINLGAPSLVNPDGTLRHNMKALPLTLNLRGPINILPDGRMTIDQLNANIAPLSVDLTVTELGIVTVDLTLDLRIPEGGNYMQYVSNPVKQ